MKIEISEAIFSKHILKNPEKTSFYKNLEDMEIIYDLDKVEKDLFLESIRLFIKKVLENIKTNYHLYSDLYILPDEFKDTLIQISTDQNLINVQTMQIEGKLYLRSKDYYDKVKREEGGDIMIRELKIDIIKEFEKLKVIIEKLIEKITESYSFIYARKEYIIKK